MDIYKRPLGSGLVTEEDKKSKGYKNFQKKARLQEKLLKAKSMALKKK